MHGWWDVETEKTEHFHCVGRRRVDPVFGCGCRPVDEAADPDCDSHMWQEALEREEAGGRSAEDNQLEADNLDGGLVQLPQELKEFRERHRA